MHINRMNVEKTISEALRQEPVAFQSVPNIKERVGSIRKCDVKVMMIIKSIQSEYNEYRYTVYRCAAKCMRFRQYFHTSNIPFKLVQAVLERHGIRDEDAKLMVPIFQLHSLIHDIYLACDKLGYFGSTIAFDLEVATNVLCNFFLDVLDPYRHHSVSLLEIKVTFLILCKIHTNDGVVSEFYNSLFDSKLKCMSKSNFESMLNVLAKILSYIGEESGYGSHNFYKVMEDCFTKRHNTLGLSEYEFHCIWSKVPTRFLIYSNLIELINRMSETAKLIHNNTCASCRLEKIIGLRFKCQICRNLSLCLKCFATGYSTNKHESGHRMYETFTEDLPPKGITYYIAKFCNIFCNSTNSGDETAEFCNSNETDNANETELATISTARKNSNASTIYLTAQTNFNKLDPSVIGLSATAANASHVSERLQAIIDKLLQQNAKLEEQLKCVKTTTNDELFKFLNAHQEFLISIISEMRNIPQPLITMSAYPPASTPNCSIMERKVANADSLATHSYLTHSLNGADFNRSYLEANKSDYSIKDLSLWFHQRRMIMPTGRPSLSILREVDSVNDCVNDSNVAIETDISNFRLLLNKVREIVDDTYSDNIDLAKATQNLENVLDTIIKSEENKRKLSC